jgi:hypothetical protein
MTDTDPKIPEDDAPAPAAAPEADSPIVPIGKAAKRYNVRFLLLYGALAAIAIAAIVGFVVLVAKPSTGSSSSSGWSDWKPKDASTAAMTKAIADHVAKEYKLNKKGSQLLGVVSQAPTWQVGTHKVSISHLAIRKAPATDKGIQIIPSGDTWDYELCGLGTACSIASGQPSETRGRLVRREALEVALYTFKFVPAINSVVAFMPPPPGQSPATLIYLQRSELEKQLSQPLRKTLPLEKPPLPTDPDLQEAATIDRLTNHTVYNYKLQQLQDASVLLVLDPFQS